MGQAEKDARRMIGDKKAATAAEAAYNAASSTPPAPAAKTAPAAKPAARRPAMVEEAMQEVQDAKDRKKISDMGYKKGGSTFRSAANGIAQRGKTRGKFV